MIDPDYVFPNERMEKYHSMYGYKFVGIKFIADTVEVVQDVYTVINLFRTNNLFEMGYFVGKSFINVVFYFFGFYLGLRHWWGGASLAADEAEEDSGTSLLSTLLFGP